MNFETIAAYLAGECKQAEKQAVEKWREESPRNEQQFRQWQLLWQASRQSHQDYTPDAAKAWQKINPGKAAQTPFKPVVHAPQNRRRTLYTWTRNLAAMLLLAAGLGWSVWQISRQQESQAMQWVEQTSADKPANEVILADGTRIWLNAHSKLRYPDSFAASRREIFLEGEAYFEVAHQPQKPFLVHTQGSVTEVLGTSFNIRSYRHEPAVEVSLLSGKVSFGLPETPAGQKALLKPGQKAILYKPGQTITVTENENQNYLAWKTGKMIFQDVALRDALQTLETYYRVDFTVSDTLLLNCRFTGSFNRAPLEDVLQVFAFGSDISYRKEGNQYVLSGAGCK